MTRHVGLLDDKTVVTPRAIRTSVMLRNRYHGPHPCMAYADAQRRVVVIDADSGQARRMAPERVIGVYTVPVDAGDIAADLAATREALA